MTNQEREQVLRMIENGKISPEDGLKLMQTLDQNPAEDEAADETKAAENEHASTPLPQVSIPEQRTEKAGFDSDPRISRVKSTVSRLWQIPLWIGVVITILSSWGMFALVQAARINFWFFCLGLVFLLSILLIVAAVGSRKARWLFVDIHQKPGDKPSHIFLGFPLPLKLAGWLLRNFGQYIPELKKANMNEVVQVIETGFTGEQPLVVNVDEGEEGERVQVYIG